MPAPSDPAARVDGAVSLESLPVRYCICIALFAGLALGVAVSADTKAALNGSPPVLSSMTTQEHLRSSAWWPTKQLKTQSQFVGTETCANCHSDIVASQRQSQMGRTLGLAQNSAVLQAHMGQTYSAGAYKYTLHQAGMTSRLPSPMAPPRDPPSCIGPLAPETSARAISGHRTAPLTRAASTTSLLTRDSPRLPAGSTAHPSRSPWPSVAR